MESPDASPIPLQPGIALAALILGVLCIILGIFIGIESLMVSLPVFGIWFFIPLPLVATILGMYAARSATGVAGAVLGVIALLLCLAFVVIDRVEGPDIRAQFTHPQANSLPSGLTMEQLLKFTHASTSQPATP